MKIFAMACCLVAFVSSAFAQNIQKEETSSVRIVLPEPRPPSVREPMLSMLIGKIHEGHWFVDEAKTQVSATFIITDFGISEDGVVKAIATITEQRLRVCSGKFLSTWQQLDNGRLRMLVDRSKTASGDASVCGDRVQATFSIKENRLVSRFMNLTVQ